MKILIVGPSWVGDMVMAQTLFIELKRLHPNAELDVLAPAWTRPLLERMPEVTGAIASDFGHGEVKLKQRKAFAMDLRQQQYDQAIVLPNSLKSALIPFWAKIKKRTGWRGEMRYGLLNDIRTLDKSHYPLMIERFIALAHPKRAPLPNPLPRPQFRIDAAVQQQAIDKLELQPQHRPVLGMCPGAEFGPSKQWPSEHYAAVAQTTIEQGGQVWIFGSANDEKVAVAIQQRLPDPLRQHCHSLAGKTSLAEAIDLLAATRQVITNDSGLMHVAAALNIPLVAIYGSTSPEFTPPLSDNAQIVSLGLECSPCFERECPLGHLNCMKQLAPEKINQTIDLFGEQ